MVLAHNVRFGGGISVAVNTIEALKRVAPDHEYCFVVPNISEYKKIDYSKNKVIYYSVANNLFRRFLFDCYELRLIYNAFEPEIILGLGNFGMNKVDTKQAILIHEPYLVNSDYKSNSIKVKIRTFLKTFRLKGILRYTQLLFFQTETMKNNFQKSFDYEGKKLLFPNVVSRQISEDKFSTPEIFNKYRDKFKLFQLGKYYRHKNFELAIEMFRRYREELKDVVLFMTLDGRSGDPREIRQVAAIQKYNLDKDIINLGGIEQSQLAGYYMSCDALFFPTLLESFSATYIEAMKFCLPIVTSRLDFAKEICKDAALYFDPYSAKSAKEAVLKLKDNSLLRNELIVKAKKRLADFPNSWDEAIRDVEKEIKKLCVV